MVVKSDTKLITLSINNEPVTVPEGTTVLQACLQNDIEVPNLCYQPLLRPWGSCRICTVEVLGRRGGLVESCAAVARDGMEVLTHSAAALESRQFILQMYLIDHALDCPTCDKSGECYLQDNTYLHNVHANPYRRPKLAQEYKHLSNLIDYKWDRCIICARCTRVCNEMIGVTAIEVLGRGLEAEIGTSFDKDLRDTTCTHCGMCIAVCPVGALTDRKFGAHPWEVDAAETICGFCDVGCTINVEHLRGIVRRNTHLWERGVNHGYTCKHGRWAHDYVQHPDRLETAMVRKNDELIPATIDSALDVVAEKLIHYQGEVFGAVASPENTNEENYLLQQFSRAVMGSNNVDRLITENQDAVDFSLLESIGVASSTNSMQEMFTDSNATLVIGPDIGETAPVASYWLYWSHKYHENSIVVVSADRYPLCELAEVWIKPQPGQEAEIVKAMARIILDEELARPVSGDSSTWMAWSRKLNRVDPATIAEANGIDIEKLHRAAVIFATGGAGIREDGNYPTANIYSTLGMQKDSSSAESSQAVNNLALMTGNIGAPGSGVINFRGHSNIQGANDMGCHPAFFPGYQSVEDPTVREQFEQAWMGRWNDQVDSQNGFKPLRELSDITGLTFSEMIDAIDAGEIRAMYISASSHELHTGYDDRLLAAIERLDFLVVEDCFESELTKRAHVVLPSAMFMEKDGSFTNADRTIQRVRYAVPAPGDAKASWWYLQEISSRLGYNLNHMHPSLVLDEIAQLTPIYQGVTFPRLERGGMQWPVTEFGSQQTAWLEPGNGIAPEAIQYGSV